MSNVISMMSDLALKKELDNLKTEDMDEKQCAKFIQAIILDKIAARDYDFFENGSAEYYFDLLPDKYVRQLTYLHPSEYLDSRKICVRVIGLMLEGCYDNKGRFTGVE